MCHVTSGTLCSRIRWVLRSGRGGCQEPGGGSSSARDGRSWGEGTPPTHPLLSPASTRCDGSCASPCAWDREILIKLRGLRVEGYFRQPSLQSYLLRPSFLARSRLDRSCRQQMRKDRDMARMTMPLTTEANTATLRPRSSGLGMAVGWGKTHIYVDRKKKKSVAACKMFSPLSALGTGSGQAVNQSHRCIQRTNTSNVPGKQIPTF